MGEVRGPGSDSRTAPSGGRSDGAGFRAAMAVADEAFWRWPLPDGPVAYSPRWAAIMGAPLGAAAGHWRERLHPDDVARVNAELEAAADGGAPHSVECRLRHQDGTYRWVRVKAIAERDADGAVAALAGTIQDLSDQRRTQDVLERLVRHNALILNAAGDGIYCLDEAGRSTFVNPAASRMLGSSVADLTGVPLCRFRPDCATRGAAIDHAMDCPVEATLRTGLPHRVYDGELQRIDGTSFPVEYVVSPIKEHQRVTGVVVVFNDVTERRWSEEEIRRERQFSDGLIKSSLDGILAFDKDLRYTIWNPAMERISGLLADQVIGREVEEVFPFLTETGEVEHLRDTLRGKTIVVTDRPYRVPETGRNGYFEARYAPLYDEAGEILGGVAVIHDITEERAREEEVRAARDKLGRSEKLAALGTLVSGVGHELRTPMSYINNHLYLLKMLADRMRAEQPDMAPVADEIIKRCTSSMNGITRMASLLDDLRATYRTDAAELVDADLRTVVDEAVRLFAGAYEGPVKLEKDLRPTGPYLVETGRIQQVVINLLNNAAEAMPDGGLLRVAVRDTESGAEIVVSDTGIGMTPEVREAVFQPFYTTKKLGSGLGLYLVKQIVGRHMGSIDCESEPGKGTTFRIRLPRRERAEAGQEEAGPRSVDEVRALLEQAKRRD